MLWAWKQGIPHSGVLLWPIYLVTQKTEKFEWGPEHQDTLQQVLAAMHGVLLRGPCDLADLSMLKCQWHRSCFMSLAGFYRRIREQTLRILEQSPVILADNTLL